MIDFFNRLSGILMVLGLVVIFIAERYLEFYKSYPWVLALGGLFIVASVGANGLRFLKARKLGHEQEAYCWLLSAAWKMVVIVGCVLYFLYRHQMGSTNWPVTAGQRVLLGSYLFCLVTGLFMGAGIELSILGAGQGRFAEFSLVKRSGFSWFLVGLLLLSLVGFNYAGAKRDQVFDWSYLKATSPSSATVNMLADISEPIKVTAFFSADNEVRPFVKEYFDRIAAQTKNLEFRIVDHELNPMLAEELKASRNGVIVLQYKDQDKRLMIGTTLTSARSKLKKLDSEVQSMIVSLTAEPKTIYFTTGHDELSWHDHQQNLLNKVDKIVGYLRRQNYQVRQLGLADGLGSEIPKDAQVIVIVGPSKDFLEAEIKTLEKYLEQGGKLFALLDLGKGRVNEIPDLSTEGPVRLYKFLSQYGLSFQRELLANDQNFVRATRSPVDQVFLYTNSYSAHESMTTLRRLEDSVAIIGYQLGYFNLVNSAQGWKTATTVRSLNTTFVDKNRNLRFDKNETRKAYDLGATAHKEIVLPSKDKKKADAEPNKTQQENKDDQEHNKAEEKTEARIAVFSDAQIISDALIENQGNAIYFIETLKWLEGNKVLASEVSSEEDVKIRHTNKDDRIWFYTTIFVVPALMLLVGFMATRVRQRKRIQKDD